VSALADALKINSSLVTLEGADLGSEEMLAHLGLPLSMLDFGTTDVIEELGRRRLPLVAASMGGQLEVVHELLERGAEVDAATRYGETALSAASAGGQLAIVRELLWHGADPNLGSDGFSVALEVAWRHSAASVAPLLSVVAVWQSDDSVARCLEGPRWASLASKPPARVRAELVATRRLRDLLRQLVDPRARECRAALFSSSPLLCLPWHLRVHILRFVVFVPIRRGWGREEFERSE